MERLERAIERQAAAAKNASQSERPIVRSLDDIRRVIEQFNPSNPVNTQIPSPVISTQLEGTIDDKKAVFNVSAPTNSKTIRDIIRDGLDIIKRRQELASKIEKEEPLIIEINGRDTKKVKVINPDGAMSIDAVIDRATAGYRRGLTICWDLPDGYTYKYDIYSHKLTRVQTDDEGTK